MVIVGLLGGIASGKSLIAEEFQRLGACVLDGDKAGHEVLEMEPVVRKLVERWGEGILSEGKIDRRALAEIVFREKAEPDSESGEAPKQSDSLDPQAELEFLESLTHPLIGKLLQERIAKIRESQRFEIVVLDAAVMIKSGWHKQCDRIIFIDVPQELREKRAILRGLSRHQFFMRERSQTPIEEKKKLADMVIDNSGPPQKTYKQVEEVWHSLLQIA